MSNLIRIIGIDPGLRRTGWGIILSEGSRLRYVADGTIKTDADLTLSERLLQIHDNLNKVIEQFTPEEAAVEETFVNKDARATLKLGHARGIAMLVPAIHNLSVAEYAPNRVKKTVVGSGHAEKEQISAMLKILLPTAKPDSADSADALAIAICHAHNRTAHNLEKQLRQAV